jgi:hypothetical protein
VQSEFNWQTESKQNQLRVEEINHEDQRRINKIVEDNPKITRDQATNIYYDSLYEMARLAMQFQRGNFLVEEEYKNLTTYMRDFHDYYMAQALETEQTGFKYIIRPPHVFHYPNEEKHFVGWECLF